MSVSGSTTLKIICSSRRNSRKVRNDVWGNGSLEDKKVATYMIVWDSYKIRQSVRRETSQL